MSVTQKTTGDKGSLRFAISLVCCVIFLVSLFLNVFLFPAGDAPCIGLFCLLFGFGHLAWYSNAMLLVSHKMMHERKAWLDRAALVIAIAALGLAFTTFSIKRLPKDEAGNMSDVIGYGAGFYLWMSSMVVTIAAQFFLIFQKAPAAGR